MVSPNDDASVFLVSRSLASGASALSGTYQTASSAAIKQLCTVHCMRGEPIIAITKPGDMMTEFRTCPVGESRALMAESQVMTWVEPQTPFLPYTSLQWVRYSGAWTDWISE